MATLANEFTVEVAAESTFNDSTSLETAVIGGIYGLDLSSVRNPVIEDETYTTDGGSHEGIEGVPHAEIGIPFSMPIEGVGSAQGDGNYPGLTAQVSLNAAAMQCTPHNLTGSLVSSATTGSVTEDADDRHAPGAGTYTILACELTDGTIEARGGTYNAGTDTFTPSQEFSAEPSGTIYGGTLLHRVDSWSGAVGRSLNVKFLGNDSGQHTEVRGCVAERSMAAFGPQDVPSFSYNLRGVAFEDLFADIRQLPTLNRRRVFAGAKVILSKFGSPSFKRLQTWRIEFADNDSFSVDEDLNEESGAAGWTRTKNTPQIKITIPHDTTPPAEIGSTTFRESKRDGGEDALYQLTVTYGTSAGQSWTRYYPKLRLKNWSRTTVGEFDGQMLTFEPATGTGLELYCDLHW